jgi:maltooligosyltrehalose trehalohydrolase
LVTFPAQQRRETAMTAAGHGYFIHQEPWVAEGLEYVFRLNNEGEYPDPASRWQPRGVHRPSAVFSPHAFPWSDAAWSGIAREDLVVYELHVGTFTPEGTFDAIVPRISDLRALGITALELMPVGQFPGQRNWGYDGVHPYAVQNSYGGPQGLQRLVDAAHRAGLAVILDVVYNHAGPEGNYLERFGPYFTDRYRTPWGKAVNFDGPGSDAVRQFVIHNARMWITDFHVDGLRLDAVHAIFDFGTRHILAELQAAVQRDAAHAGRRVQVFAETNQNDVRLIRPRTRGGHGLDGVWSDDFHHSVHALLTGERVGYYEDFGTPAHLAKALRQVFVYDGCYSRFRQRCHGSRVGASDRTRFVVCIQNHDQIGNRVRGDRWSTLVTPAAQRLACALLMLSPCVPLLFMGEEYGEQHPFPFFCSFEDSALVQAIREGRRREFTAMRLVPAASIPDPQDPQTFAAAKLSWAWPAGSPHAQLRQLYHDLLAARRRWIALSDRRHTSARIRSAVGADSGAGSPSMLVVRRGANRALLAVANLDAESVSLPTWARGGPACLLTTEDAVYGGSRASVPTDDRMLPYELLIFDHPKGPP